MPESDVTNMKVADLKRELKMRGLATTGNKNELQDRLQTALIEGDISLDDSVIADELVDDVGDLTDDEDKLLVDENELLKSPISSPTEEHLLASPEILTTKKVAASPKKIILKRETSISTTTATTSSTNVAAAATDASKLDETTAAATKENATPVAISTRKPIIVGGGSQTSSSSETTTVDKNKKVTELTAKERLELRAKRFGVQSSAAAATPSTESDKTSTTTSKTSSASILANKGNKETDAKQMEALKRRAERFGCVVSTKLVKQDAVEKLNKRKERFGNSITEDKSKNTTAAASTDANSDIWAEKARARLERFKVAPAAENTNN